MSMSTHSNHPLAISPITNTILISTIIDWLQIGCVALLKEPRYARLDTNSPAPFSLSTSHRWWHRSSQSACHLCPIAQQKCWHTRLYQQSSTHCNHLLAIHSMSKSHLLDELVHSSTQYISFRYFGLILFDFFVFFLFFVFLFLFFSSFFKKKEELKIGIQ